MEPTRRRRPTRIPTGPSTESTATAAKRAVHSHHLTLALVEAHVGALVDVLPIALLVTSADGEVVRANPAAVELFGATRAVPGAFVNKLLPFMDDSETSEPVRGAIISCDRIRPVDVRLRRLQHVGEVVRLYVVHG